MCFRRSSVKLILLVTLMASFSACCTSYLAEVDLVSFLTQVDPPEGLNAGQVEVLDPLILPDLRAVQGVAQGIENEDGDRVGQVSVYLFRSHPHRDEAFQLFSLMETPEGLIPFAASNVGEDSIAAETERSAFATFVRCYAVASVRLDETEGGSQNTQYRKSHPERSKGEHRTWALLYPSRASSHARDLGHSIRRRFDILSRTVGAAAGQ